MASLGKRHTRAATPVLTDDEEIDYEYKKIKIEEEDQKVLSKMRNNQLRPGDKPAELFRKDLISAMKLADTESLGVEEYYQISDSWKQEWEKGVQVPVNPDIIRHPDIIPCPERAGIEGAYPFKLPRKLLHAVKDETFQQGCHELHDTQQLADQVCRYDLDYLDVQWLQLTNAKFSEMGLEPVEEWQMEKVMEEIESQCHENMQIKIKTEEGLGIEYDENVTCDVCRSPEGEDTNEIVFCDKCDICVHQACYGIQTIPAGSWVCRTCVLGVKPTCVLCPNLGGAMKSTKSGSKWAHVSCALWIPEVRIGDPEKMEPIQNISLIPVSRWSLTCSVCRERSGACIQCSVKSCKTAFHVTCAFHNGFDMKTVFEDGKEEIQLKGYCEKHSSKNEAGKVPDTPTKRQSELTEAEKKEMRSDRLRRLAEEFYTCVDYKDVSKALNMCEEQVSFVYQYWVLKRKSSFNNALLTPKTEEADLLSKQEEESLIARMKMFVHLRQDLERVRNLCYMVSRREKIRRSLYKCKEQIFIRQLAVVKQTQPNEMNTRCMNHVLTAHKSGTSVYDKYGVILDMAARSDEPPGGVFDIDHQLEAVKITTHQKQSLDSIPIIAKYNKLNKLKLSMSENSKIKAVGKDGSQGFYKRHNKEFFRKKRQSLQNITTSRKNEKLNVSGRLRARSLGSPTKNSPPKARVARPSLKVHENTVANLTKEKSGQRQTHQHRILGNIKPLRHDTPEELERTPNLNATCPLPLSSYQENQSPNASIVVKRKRGRPPKNRCSTEAPQLGTNASTMDVKPAVAAMPIKRSPGHAAPAVNGLRSNASDSDASNVRCTRRKSKNTCKQVQPSNVTDNGKDFSVANDSPTLVTQQKLSAQNISPVSSCSKNVRNIFDIVTCDNKAESDHDKDIEIDEDIDIDGDDNVSESGISEDSGAPRRRSQRLCGNGPVESHRKSLFDLITDKVLTVDVLPSEAVSTPNSACVTPAKSSPRAAEVLENVAGSDDVPSTSLVIDAAAKESIQNKVAALEHVQFARTLKSVTGSRKLDEKYGVAINEHLDIENVPSALRRLSEPAAPQNPPLRRLNVQLSPCKLLSQGDFVVKVNNDIKQTKLKLNSNTTSAKTSTEKDCQGVRRTSNNKLSTKSVLTHTKRKLLGPSSKCSPSLDRWFKSSIDERAIHTNGVTQRMTRSRSATPDVVDIDNHSDMDRQSNCSSRLSDITVEGGLHVKQLSPTRTRRKTRSEGVTDDLETQSVHSVTSSISRYSMRSRLSDP